MTGGYVMGYGDCFACHRAFTYNPEKVPTHKNEPVCPDCLAKANEARVALGKPPHVAHPDAYKPVEL